MFTNTRRLEPGISLQVFAAACLVLAVSTARARTDPLAGLDRYIEQAMHDWQTPGLAVAVVRNDSVVFIKGYGVREQGKPGQIDPETVFALSSNGKAFTVVEMTSATTSVLQLWDAKHVAACYRCDLDHTPGYAQAKVQNIVMPHLSTVKGPKPIPWRIVDSVGPAGSINANVSDVANWVRMQLGGGMFKGKRIVSSAALAQMHTPQMLVPDAPYPGGRGFGHFWAYGLGWFIGEYQGRKLVIHTGEITGFDSAIALLHPGRRLCEEIHKLGIILDVGGHTGEQTSLDAIAMSKGVPIVCTHTNVAALNANPRAASDRVFEAIAATGGVIGLTAISDFHMRSQHKLGPDGGRSPRASLEVHLDQYDYLKKLVGVDHVGLGPDFVWGWGNRFEHAARDSMSFPPESLSDGKPQLVEAFENISMLPNVERGLSARGWSRSELDKLMGANWLRVYEQVWRG